MFIVNGVSGASVHCINFGVATDLGCGTGLELDRIFERFPDLAVTGIDLSPDMLERLARKHEGKRLTLICADYFGCDLGDRAFPKGAPRPPARRVLSGM